MSGVIFNIQRFCVHDGPGIRTTVFFKGCPLRCGWCANPESQSPLPELMYDAVKCVRCLKCAAVCPTGAMTVSAGAPALDRTKCAACGSCVEACAFGALEKCGREADARTIMDEILRDSGYFAMSGGGVTFSGGEPTARAALLTELLAMCRRHSIDTAVETCGVCDRTVFAGIAAKCDRLLFDVKLTDADALESFTGARAELVRDNLLAASHLAEVTVRVPLVPGVNMTDGFASGLAELLAGAPVRGVELLPYHRLGSRKYARLGRKYALENLAPPERAECEAFAGRLREKCAAPVKVV